VRGVVETPGAQVVDAGTTLQRQGALHHSVGGHLSGKERRGVSGGRNPECDREGERRLARGDVAPKDDQVTTPRSTAEEQVETGESRWNRIMTCHALHERVESCRGI
jgi:hypothetical protein